MGVEDGIWLDGLAVRMYEDIYNGCLWKCAEYSCGCKDEVYIEVVTRGVFVFNIVWDCLFWVD